jgi:hypothetical protein
MQKPVFSHTHSHNLTIMLNLNIKHAKTCFLTHTLSQFHNIVKYKYANTQKRFLTHTLSQFHNNVKLKLKTHKNLFSHTQFHKNVKIKLKTRKKPVFSHTHSHNLTIPYLPNRRIVFRCYSFSIRSIQIYSNFTNTNALSYE